MPDIPVSDGITSRFMTFHDVQYHMLERGHGNTKIVLLHGNVSSATWWEELMLALPEDEFHTLALDMRGYGLSDPAPIDATRGVEQISHDVGHVVRELGWERYHMVGHSLGAGIALDYLEHRAQSLASITLIGAMSPYGFGGTHDVAGTPVWPDFAGTGGGLGNPDLIRLMAANDMSMDEPTSPRNVLRVLIFNPEFRHPREDVIVTSLNATHLSDDNYPGDALPSENWPYFAPGTRGINNALSPKYFDTSGIVNVEPKPPIWWVRGAGDLIVSNAAASDMGRKGRAGLVDDWPGDEVFPPQPMLDQIRDVLTRYGNFAESVYENCGHSPHIEDMARFVPEFLTFLRNNP